MMAMVMSKTMTTMKKIPNEIQKEDERRRRATMIMTMQMLMTMDD